MKIARLIIFVWLVPNLLYAQNSVDIDALLADMSLEEKVGQMCQIDLGVVAKGDICNLQIPQEIDMQKLEAVFSKYYVGSVLNVGCGAGAMELDRWKTILRTLDQTNLKYQPHKIPVLFGIDAIHGAGYTKGSVLLPQQLAQAATWNPELIAEGYKMTAYETRATGIPWNFSPVLDLGRQPLWSRFFETFGEDVHLAKTMTTAAIQGLQGDDISDPYRLAACMKHFLGYSHPQSGKDRTPVYMSERTLREYYLPTFERAIELGAATVMINSGEIDGIPVHANKEILTGLLREELGFQGVALTDWEDIWKLVNVHHVAASKKEAVRIAIDAGIDMSMVPNDTEFCDLLVELVREGSISQARIDLSVRRILQLKKNVGLFKTSEKTTDYSKFGSQEHSEISYRTAAEAITLLKNDDHTLPLSLDQKIAVIGLGADSINVLNGAWSRTWQGTEAGSEPAQPTILDALKSKFKNVAHISWDSQDEDLSSESILQKAQAADVLVVCLAETPSTEIPGNISSLDLDIVQQALVAMLFSLGKKIVLVCNFNRPRIITGSTELSDAVVYAYQPGQEGARAIADILAGDINPSGKLPFTYPRASGSVVHYDRKHSEDIATDFSTTAYKPLYDFGHGLSYTTFEYSNLNTNKSDYRKGENIVVHIDVKNTGDLEGQEVVQVYYSDEVASVTPSVRKLCGYQKVKLAAGESQTVEISIPLSELSLVARDLKRVVESGDFALSIKNLNKKIHVH